jgi:CRP-like cAMP-binding protein
MVTSTQSDRNASTVELLESSPHFAKLEVDTLDRVGSLLVERRIEKDEIIWLEQDPAKRVYFVASGLIKLFKASTEGKEQILRLVRPGDCFGHTGIFNGGSNPENAQAVVPSVLYGLMGSDLETLLWEHKQLAFNTIKSLAKEIHHLINLVEDLSLRQVSGRLARMLLEHSSEGVLKDSLFLTRGDMAAMTGTVREVFGRSLKALEEKGVVQSNRRSIAIRDIDVLKMMIGSA